MEIVYSTAWLVGASDQAGALACLQGADLGPIELGPLAGDLAQPGVAVTAHLAFLPAEIGRPNLAAADDDFRNRSVQDISEALARCEWLGIRSYGVEAGWNLTQTLLRDGTVLGAPGRRAHALAQLERSLDRLAELAISRGLVLRVANLAPAAGGLLVAPAEIREVLGAVGAPNVSLALDLAAWEVASRRRFEPASAAGDVAGLLGCARVPVRALPEPWMVGAVATWAGIPLILTGPDTTPEWLRACACRLLEALHAPA